MTGRVVGTYNNKRGRISGTFNPRTKIYDVDRDRVG